MTNSTDKSKAKAHKAKAIKELIEIRDTGFFNLFTERQNVMQYANKQGMFHLVSYCGNDRSKYLELLNSDWEQIKEWNDNEKSN